MPATQPVASSGRNSSRSATAPSIVSGSRNAPPEPTKSARYSPANASSPSTSRSPSRNSALKVGFTSALAARCATAFGNSPPAARWNSS